MWLLFRDCHWGIIEYDHIPGDRALWQLSQAWRQGNLRMIAGLF